MLRPLWGIKEEEYYIGGGEMEGLKSGEIKGQGFSDRIIRGLRMHGEMRFHSQATFPRNPWILGRVLELLYEQWWFKSFNSWILNERVASED